MKSRSVFFGLALLLAVFGRTAEAQGYAQNMYGPQQGEIRVNGRLVTTAEMEALQRQLGVPGQAVIQPGDYWYDRFSGLWGIMGGPAMGQIYPGLDLGGPMPSHVSGGGTGVFVNGREIHMLEVLYLQQIFGYVMPGRYWMNPMGIGGMEGGPASFDLRAAVAQAGGDGGGGGGYGGYTNRTPFGSTGGDGNCSYYLHPGGSSVMTC